MSAEINTATDESSMIQGTNKDQQMFQLKSKVNQMNWIFIHIPVTRLTNNFEVEGLSLRSLCSLPPTIGQKLIGQFQIR